MANGVLVSLQPDRRCDESECHMSDLRNKIESYYDGAMTGRGQATTEAGTLYITIKLSGIKQQGSPFPMLAPSQEMAEDYLKFFLKALPPVQGGILVWRHLPEFVDGRKLWTIRARAVMEVRNA